MTTKRYPESQKLSRSQKARRPTALPDHYSAAQPPPTSEEHPVDVLIDHMPGMAARRQKLATLRHLVQRQVRRQRDFIMYEDGRLDYAIRREQAYFNAGFDRGHLAGLADSHEASAGHDPKVRKFAHDICHAIASSKAPMAEMAAALIDVARAVVLASRRR